MLSPNVVQSCDELSRRRETMCEVIRLLCFSVIVKRARIKPVDQGRVLVDTHVICAPFGQVWAVTGVIATTEMDGDKAVQCALEI